LRLLQKNIINNLSAHLINASDYIWALLYEFFAVLLFKFYLRIKL